MQEHDTSFQTYKKQLQKAHRIKDDPGGKVINLSRHQFRYMYLFIRQMSSSSCTPQYDKNELRNDLKAIFRRMELKAHLGISKYERTISQ